jgi:large subunit ribosomal protein L17
MRHGDKIKNLSRTAAHRTALLCNLTNQLIQYKRITTTLAKAKALRVFAEPIITRCKTDTMHNRRIVFSYLQEKEAIKELFGVISDKVADRPGGYTRIIKLPRRAGDAADMAMIELVDFNEIYGKETDASAAKKTRRSRRSSGASKKATTDAAATNTLTEEMPIAAAETTYDEPIIDEVVEETTETVSADTTQEEVVADAQSDADYTDATASTEEETNDTAENKTAANEDEATA